MGKTISAREAAAILGVSPATLYAYVSRGLLASSSDSGGDNDNRRAKRYARDDVLRLAARRGDGKRAGHAVAASLSWGVPVLETRIARIDGGRLYYRGTDACALARHATLEQAAALLWQPWLDSAPPAGEAGQDIAGVMAPWRDARPAAAALTALAPLPRAMALLPVVADADSHAAPLALLRLTAGLLLGADAGPVPSAPLHSQAAEAWGLDARAADVLRGAMVVLADHELNNSAFTVRCVASSGAALPLVLCAGLAALSGDEHGGHYRVAKAVLQREAHAPGSVAIRPMTPGFGHPLYPEGDIRAAYLLDRLREYDAAACAPYTALAARAAARSLTPSGTMPNSDFALAALELVLGLPDGAALALLAMARTAGWIAHALEQREDGRMIRPRARYVGEFGTV